MTCLRPLCLREEDVVNITPGEFWQLSLHSLSNGELQFNRSRELVLVTWNSSAVEIHLIVSQSLTFCRLRFNICHYDICNPTPSSAMAHMLCFSVKWQMPRI